MTIEDKPSTQADGITMSGGRVYSLATKGSKDVIDGGTSMAMARSAIEKIRRSQPDLLITVFYTDQPRNDFNALVQNVHGLGPFMNYLEEFKNVFPMFSGTSFYRQILPGNSLHLGFSATAMHWLSAKPGDISNHVHMIGASGQELDTFRSQSPAD